MIKNLLKNRKKRFSFYGILTLIFAVFFGGSYAATISQMSSNGIKGFDVINYFATNIFINLKFSISSPYNLVLWYFRIKEQKG